MKQKKIIELSCNRYQIILDEIHFLKWAKKLEKSSIFALNIATDNLNSVSSNLIAISFAIDPGEAAYIPITHNNKNLNDENQLSFDQVFTILKPILEDKKKIKIGQNLKYGHKILRNYCIELRGIEFDVMLESYSLNSILGQHDIDTLSKRWLKNNISNSFSFTEKEKNYLIHDRTIIEIGQNTAKNADIALQLHQKIWPELQKNKGPLEVFQHIEMPLVPVLSRIEKNGVKIDHVALQKYSKEIEIRLTDLKQKAHKIAGEFFNLSSTKQVEKILFKKHGMTSVKKTPCGSLSTSEDVLKKLSLNHPIPKVILEYRWLSKLQSAYVNKLPLMINQKTGRIHTSYHQTVTSTGRLSSTNPNLQNIPVRHKEGRRIRQAFIAPKDHVIVSADYSQIELRIIAHLSRDKNLLALFNNNIDVHSATAAEIFNLSIDNVTEEQRRIAKIINFSLVYGTNAFGLSRQLNISYKESQKYIELYFQHYPDILNYMKRTCFYAKKKGFIETIKGRRLYLPDIGSADNFRRLNAERAAVNAPIQGTAADIIKLAMIAVDSWIEKEHPRVLMIMQVHDELVFEVHKDDVQIISKKIYELMENSIKLDVSLPVIINSGTSWDKIQ